MLCVKNTKILEEKYINSSTKSTSVRYLKNWLKEGNFLSKMHDIERWEKKCVSNRTDELNIVVYRWRKNIYLADSETEQILTEYQKLLSKRVYLLSNLVVFFKRKNVLVETTVPG